MRKIKSSIAVFLAVLMILCAFPVAAFAAENEADPAKATATGTNSETVEAADDSVTGRSHFKDVKESSWYADAVRYVYENGLFCGVSKNEFAPQETMTRAMFVQVLANMSSNFDPEDYTTSSFKDVDEKKWYFEAVEWAKDMGLVMGVSEDAFAPLSPITREQAARILLTYFVKVGAVNENESGYFLTKAFDEKYGTADAFELDEEAYTAFPDTKAVSLWAVDAMKWVTSFGLYNGTKEHDVVLLAPRYTLTRAQTAALMQRAMGLLENHDLSVSKTLSLSNN